MKMTDKIKAQSNSGINFAYTTHYLLPVDNLHIFVRSEGDLLYGMCR